MNFRKEFKKGQSGGNKGIPMGDGVDHISSTINGLQRARIYGVAAAPKAGKSTFVDYAFVLEPILYAIAHNIRAEWIYLSFELDRVSKEFDFAAYFLHKIYGIENIALEPGITKDGLAEIPLTSDYLRGRVQDDNGETIKVKSKIEDVLFNEIYPNHIIPIMGEYDDFGKKIKSGYINFIEQKDNPTGIYKNLIAKAAKEGTWIEEQAGQSKRRIGYTPNDPDKFVVIITDHLRKLIPERGFTLKQTVDKYLEYQVELRNWCGYTFIDIIHTNRGVTDQQRIQQAKDLLYPNSDDIKDTGNLAEDVDYLFTMFDPNDQRYRLKKHFGLEIVDTKGNPYYPNMRTIHLVESRHCKYPQHFRVNMKGGVKSFERLKIN